MRKTNGNGPITGQTAGIGAKTEFIARFLTEKDLLCRAITPNGARLDGLHKKRRKALSKIPVETGR